ncbi:hypothetical protein KPL39_02220 [Clostridium gasigenes]|uniref:hypothetical protein n=1 Tax=Clostridium gasigenes TaxID=94869 RepID=UPI001C0DE729|nr:hypothetical protein [Clostridium gasigenes]MBU3135077.1 hypothetical protein [Clostridium gasigenes]
MNKVININDYRKKVPYEKQIEIDVLVEEIIGTEKFSTRVLKRGGTLRYLESELEERLELINRFMDICTSYRIDFKTIHDYKEFDRFLEEYKNR